MKVSAVCNVRNLGTWFNNHLSIKTAINKTCQSGLYHLHNMGRIKRFLSSEDGKSIVQEIVMSRIDYCNSLLYGVAATNLSKLQRVQNPSRDTMRKVWRDRLIGVLIVKTSTRHIVIYMSSLAAD